MAEILIVYSSIDGQTRRICERLQHGIEQRAHQVTLASLHDEPDLDIGRFTKVVVGASVRYGTHRRQVYQFVASHAAQLSERRSAFFSVNAVARKPQKCQPHTNPYPQKFLAETAWRPDAVAVFAGRIDYPRYRFWDRLVIQLIMKLTGGPTDPHAVVEFTDWQQVEAFAVRISEL